TALQTPHLSFNSSHVLTLAKRSTTLDPFTPLVTQLHSLNLFGDETPYKSLHAVVSQGVKPWIDAFVGSRGGSAKDIDTNDEENSSRTAKSRNQS
ncbi:dynein heavy chain, partial [Marasmius crinis-equi]